jgi:hypothetical protein
MPAFLAGPLVKWIAIGVVIALLAAGVVWFRHEAQVAREAQALAETARDLAQADATRWHAASDLRDGAIEQLKGAYQIQSDKVKEGRAREADMARSLADAAQRNRDLQQANSQLEQDLDAEVAKTPGDVREIGPIVAKRAAELFK